MMQHVNCPIVRWVIIVLSICMSHVCISGESTDIYEIGDTRTYRVEFPRRGFIGAPSNAIMARPALQKPKDKDDFEHVFVRLSVTGKRELQNDAVRRVIRVDKIDAKGQVLVKGVYFIYIDTMSARSRIVCRDKDDNGDVGYRGTGTVHESIPCLFTTGKPPALAFKNGRYNGYQEPTKEGAFYIKKGKNKKAGRIRVDVVSFQVVANSDSDTTPKGWYRVDCYEKQTWKTSDWWWDQMKRYDANGNLLLRCEKIDI